MTASARPMTLADVAIPRPAIVHNVLLVLGAAALTGAAAQLEIRLPWTPVPITGQTFAVLLSGAVLGPRRAFIAQIVYLLSGIMGAPVFSGGAAGPQQIAGPTGGYLMAFPIAALVTGFLASRGWDRRFFTMAAAMLLGSAVIFACGLAWLSRFMPASGLIASGLAPFIPGDLIKTTLAALAFPALWRTANGSGTRS